MKILITEPEYYPRELIMPLEKIGKVVAESMGYDRLLSEIQDTDALIVRVGTRVDKKIIDNAKKLKIIASMTTGLDHIDVKHAEERGIKIVSLPGYATVATAEYTMALILSLVRKIPWAFEHLRGDSWERHRFLGTELSGKTLGIIGFGKIGSRVAKYAEAFGMDVIFYDPYLDKTLLQHTKARLVKLDEIFENSDVITIHTFLSRETERMVGREQFSKMKRGALVVNASRGLIIDESDLIDALTSGKISGAALDVFEDEPLPTSHRLTEYAKSHDNLLLTPHIAGSTRESIETAAKFVTDSIVEHFKGK